MRIYYARIGKKYFTDVIVIKKKFQSIEEKGERYWIE